MDNHPIPQDVTGFQFKLIGSMTVKQFGYVMFGVILAVILYYLPIQSAFGVLLKIFLIPVIGVSGFLIAFLPVEGRPVDVMVGNFIKALFMPNQFVYHKTGRLLNFTVITAQKLPPTRQTTSSINNNNKAQQVRQLLQAAHTKKPNKLDERETTFLQSILTPANTAAVAPITVVSEPPALTKTPSASGGKIPLVQATPSPQLQTQPVVPPATNQAPQDTLAQQEHLLREQLAEAKKDELLHQATGEASTAHQKTQLLERQVQALHFQRQQLEQQLLHLQNQLAQQQKINQQAPPQTVAPQQTAQQQTKTPSPDVVKKTGLPHVPDTPNVIAGVVKDPRGNVLPNILVEVKDKEGNPVRAFKTNTLGQFASATPLAPGNYTVELEDPKKQNRFDVIQLAATNQILLPIEIISHDAREELRKQLFN